MALVGNAVRSRSRRALTLVEVLIVLFVLVLIIAVLLPSMNYAPHSARQIKCGTQIRNVVQAMTIFAQSNKDSYPLPSLLDLNNQTVAAEVQREKDTTNNVLSILVFNSSISPELLFSPSESNSNIKVFSGYQNANPKTAVNPANALWDPALRCDFTTGEGHISYAMLMPSGDTAAPPTDAKARGRLATWSNSFNPNEAVFGNRGPLVTGRDKSGDPIYDKKSLTMLIHGGRNTWEGNIGYNDNHVNFETRMNPTEITYRSADGKQKADIIFFDEPDEAAGLNAFLGIWVKAGMLPGEFKGIHD